MSFFDVDLLICTNGAPSGKPALEYGLRLAQGLAAAGQLSGGRKVLVLGVVERLGGADAVRSQVSELAEQLAAAGVPVETQVESGRAEMVLARAAQQGRYMTVLGRLGRPFWQNWVQGRAFRRVLAGLASPLLYVPGPALAMPGAALPSGSPAGRSNRSQDRQLTPLESSTWPPRRILACSGGLDYAISLERACTELARVAGAELTILHVVEPVSLDYKLAMEVSEHWKDLLNTQTPQARHLQNALDKAQAAGVRASVKVRRGNVIHEILEEIRTGQYDLVGLGSPHSAHSLRHLYMPNVTAEVGETGHVPVLSVRYGWE